MPQSCPWLTTTLGIPWFVDESITFPVRDTFPTAVVGEGGFTAVVGEGFTGVVGEGLAAVVGEGDVPETPQVSFVKVPGFA